MDDSPRQEKPTVTYEAGVMVRPARRDDAPAIGRLVVALAGFEKLEPPDEAARARLIDDAFRPNPRVEIFLAEADGQVIGYAFVFETYSTFLALPTLYLEDLFIMPEFRGRGAGSSVMKYLAAEALRRGCGRFEWTVLHWNEPAIGFYRRLGANHLHEWHIYRLDRAGVEALASEQLTAQSEDIT